MHFQKFLNFLGINLYINLVCLKIATEAKKESYKIKTLLKTNKINIFLTFSLSKDEIGLKHRIKK
jgi:hypothetical protein